MESKRGTRQGLPDRTEEAVERPEILQGTLDMLILRVLSLEEMHGWAISRRIQQVSGNVLLDRNRHHAARLIDFGLAKARDEARARRSTGH